MAKKKESNFIDLMDKQPTINSIEDDKQKFTKRLANKVERISKTLSTPRIKKLFNNATPLNKFIEKHKQEQKQKQINDKNTKVDKLESETGVLDMLTKILGFMQKTHDEDKLAAEEQRNYAEENALEKSRKQKELLEALKGKKGGSEDKAEKEIEKETGGMGILGTVSEILSGLGGLSTIMNIGKFFLFNPIGLGLLGGATLLTLLGRDKDPEATNKGIQNAGKADGGMAESIMETVASTPAIERRKQNILANRPWSKKSLLPWKDPELQKQYLDEIGFDPKTGLTQEETKAGYTGVDEEGMPVKKKLTEQKSTTSTSTAEGTSPTTDSTTSTEKSATQTPPKASAVPAPAENAGSKVTAATNTNNDMKLQESSPATKTYTENKTTNISNVKAGGTMQRIPPVRNQEESFQRMIVYSTRVV